MIERMFVSRESDRLVEGLRVHAVELLHAGLEPSNSETAIAAIRALTEVERMVEAAHVDLMAAIDRRCLHYDDGHVSAKTMVRHVAKVSPAVAAGREKSMKTLRDLPDVADRFRSGQLGVDQMRRLGRTHANPRVRDAMPEFQDWFLKQARRLSYADFDRAMQVWEQLADADGPEPSDDAGRHASITQVGVDGEWMVKAGFGSMSGLSLSEIFDHYLAAELDADWEKAKAEHGEDTCSAHLPRTHRQRSADALWQIFQDAASNPDGATPVGFVHNIAWNAETLEHMVKLMFGADAEPLDVDDYLCRSIDGHSVNPRDAAARIFIDRLRRVVIDAGAVVIDQGQARTFTGSARLAVQLGATHCVWPGCDQPTSRCQIDHMAGHAGGGRTNPGNGAPLCGRHNRTKERGYTICRWPDGSWSVTRPDGTPIE